jgi:hypothetical protein
VQTHHLNTAIFLLAKVVVFVPLTLIVQAERIMHVSVILVKVWQMMQQIAQLVHKQLLTSSVVLYVVIGKTLEPHSLMTDTHMIAQLVPEPRSLITLATSNLSSPIAQLFHTLVQSHPLLDFWQQLSLWS